MGNNRNKLFHLQRVLRYMRGAILRLDAMIIRLPYARCRFSAMRQAGGSSAYGELSSPSFERKCRDMRVDIPSFHDQGMAGSLCQWYMSHRLSWVTSIRIESGGCARDFPVLPAPPSLELARQYLQRALAAGNYWAGHVIGRDNPSQRTPSVLQGPKRAGTKAEKTASDRLVFDEAGRMALRKAEDDIRDCIGRMAVMNTPRAAGELSPEVESFVLGRLAEAGFSVEKPAMDRWLSDEFGILWADSIIDQINERHWPQLKGVLVPSDDSRYYLDKKHFNTISNE